MKVNEQQKENQEKLFKENLSFEEWLEYFSKEPTSEELDKMEKDSKTKKRVFYPSNNPFYLPQQGA